MKMKLIGWMLMIPFLLCLLYVTFAKIDYGRNIEGHLKLAADANTVSLAQKELQIAISAMENRGLTSGSSHFWYSHPSTDIGYWYENISSSKKELEELDPEASQLEKTNVLMKLRETLLDGEEVTHPNNIAVYPNVRLFWISLVISFLFAIAGLVILSEEFDIRW